MSQESADALGVRVNGAINATLEKIADVLRPVQRDAYKCAYEMYADLKRPSKDLSTDVEKCFTKVEAGSALVHEEMSRSQARIERCRVDAMDSLKDEISGKTKTDDAVLEKKFVALLVPCLDKTINALPAIVTRVKDSLK